MTKHRSKHRSNHRSAILSHARLAAALLAALAAPALADGADGVRDEAPVTVTAQRHAQTTDEALASVTVITRADIERSQAPDLIDLLARQAGVDVARTGGPGAQSTVFLRGANSAQTLYLVDGIRVNSTGQGVFDLAHLPLEAVERIEIVRGPRAALWGSDAIGGVIHVITRDPGARSLSVHAGGQGRVGASAQLGLAGDAGSLGVAFGAEDVDGFNSTTPDNFSFDPDRDGYARQHASLGGRFALGERHALSLRTLATRAKVDFDQGRTEADNTSGALTLAGALGAGGADYSVALGEAREDLATAAFGSAFESRRRSLDAMLGLPLGGSARLQAGVNLQREDGTSLSSFSGTVFERSRDNHAGFVAASARAGAHAFEAAVRHDDNDQFGTATSGSAAWGWTFAEGWKARASWAEGFRAPTFNELYSPGFGGLFAGNPALRPEASRSTELGLEWTPAAGHQLDLAAYRTRVRDLVAFSGPLFQAININRAEVDGAELGYAWTAGAWRLEGQLTWQQPIDADTGRRLLRRADRKAGLAVDYAFANGVALGLEGQAASERQDFDGPLAGYGLLHARVALPLGRSDWRLEARVENLLDRDYTLASGYATPGRTALLRLRWAPEG
jgi:vitamin B12 transporter